MPFRTRSAYAFLAPYLLVFATFWVWPIIDSFLISFQNTRINPWKYSFQANWGRLFYDPAFYNALYNTLIILVIQVPVMIALATVMAVLLNSPLLKARPLFRFAFFAPVVVGEVAYAAVFRLMFSLDFGIINKMISAVGFSPISWFDNANAAMAVIILAVTWRWAGYNAIIILAGLQAIPDDVYEAATAIQDAAAAGNYRLAVRHSYRYLLHLLQERELIAFQTAKTNYQYAYELSGTMLHRPFLQLTRGYEYAWYGGLPVAKERFEAYYQEINGIKKDLH